MNAQLSFENNSLEISNFCHFREEAKQGNPYNTTFELAVQSGAFRGVAPCECDIKVFERFADALHKLYNFESFTADLDDICYGSKVKFVMNAAGHLEITGKIYGEAMEHSMEFVFNADQTVLKQFIEEIDELLCQLC